MRYRSYDPYLRRFLSHDPLADDPLFNLYAPFENHPGFWRDPWGLGVFQSAKAPVSPWSWEDFVPFLSSFKKGANAVGKFLGNFDYYESQAMLAQGRGLPPGAGEAAKRHQEAAAEMGEAITGLGLDALFLGAAGLKPARPIIEGVVDLTAEKKLGTTVGNVAYRSLTGGGDVQYVGITNNLARRAAEHLRSSGFQIEKVLGGLSRSDARAVEQALIEIHGLNNGTLANKINSIARTNPSYARRVQRGYELLQTIGYK